MDLRLILEPQLPALAWLARIDQQGQHVTVRHGSAVERGDNWMAEGVWDGDFGDTFAAAEHFFGSGLQVSNGAVTLVPSCALVDRLLWAEHDGVVWASNSLCVLLASAGWRLEPGKAAIRAIYAVTSGIDHFDGRIPTTAGTIHQLYYHNLQIEGNKRRLRPKALPTDFSGFEDYVSHLIAATERVGRNLSSPSRAAPVRPLGTISRGYDSPAVCAIARAAGVRTCFTRQRSNSLLPSFLNRAATDDDGTVIAKPLGLEARALSRQLPDEIPFLAGSFEPELIFASLAAEIAASGQLAAVFTGYHGDMLWRTDAFEDARATQLIRHDMSGLNLGEIRLRAGFFNVPLTFAFARSQASIGRISRSTEMQPWRNGSDYDRPIPRRILTEAGVDGRLFGVRKKAVVDRPELPSTKALRDEFVERVRQDTGYGRAAIEASRALQSALSGYSRVAKQIGLRKPVVYRPRDIRTRLYVWAVNRLADEYAVALR